MTIRNDDNLKDKLGELQNQIKSIDASVQRLLQSSERQTERREAGWLVFGVILGGLLSISVNLWTDYFAIVIQPELNIWSLVGATIPMIAVFVFLLWWSVRRLRG